NVTIVLVSHALGTVANMCDRAVWLDHGRMLADGPAPDVCTAYLDQVNASEDERHATAREVELEGIAAGITPVVDPARAVSITGVELLDPAQDRELQTVRTGAPLRLRVHLLAKEPVTG